MSTKDWIETDGVVASVDSQSTRGGELYTVVFTYKVNDHFYGGTFHTYDAYRVDDSIAVKYNPADPDQNDLVEREKLHHWIIFGVIAAVVLVGIYVIFLK